MDFGKMGGMSTATVAAKGTEGGMQQTGWERTRGETRGWEHERITIEETREDGYESPLIRATE
jgi:hypothetical protein